MKLLIRPTPVLRRVAMLCAALALAACSTRPPSTLLVLPAAKPPPTTGMTTTPAGVMLVRRVALPEHVMSRHVRYRAEASTLAEWPSVVWAERIEVAVTREFMSELRTAMPAWTLCEPGCAAAAVNPTSTLQVELAPLDFIRAQGRLKAQARVTLQPPTGSAHQLVLDFDIAASADTPQAHAEALAELLRQMATSVAQAATSR